MNLIITPTQYPPEVELAHKASLDISQYRHTSPMAALDLLPKPFWKGIQREGTVSIIAGESKAKKSWLVMSKTQHALLGRPFLGHDMPPPSSGTPRKALFLDFELPEEVFLFRWIALAGEFDEEDRDILFDPNLLAIECYRRFMSEPRDWIAHCCDRINTFCQHGDAAVVDCLQPIMPEGESANNAEVVRPVIAKFQAAATETGAVVDVVDHFNKGGEGRGMNRISGSMAKAAGPDTVITLNSEPPGIAIEMDLRMDPPLDGMHVEFEPYAFKVFNEDQLAVRKESIQAEKDAKVVDEMFPDGRWYGREQLAERCGISTEAVAKRIAKLGETVEVDDSSKKHLYRRTSNPPSKISKPGSEQ